MAEEFQIFLLAVQLLTRLPVPKGVSWTPERIAASSRWYPAVGLLVGGATAMVFYIAALVYPPGLAALLSTAAGILLTGAFHEDGLADACDGLGGGTTKERSLEIMRDSRIGSYGGLGLGLNVAIKIAVLATMPIAAVPLVLLAAHSASRASSVLVIASSVYVRSHGTGKHVSAGISKKGLAVAFGTGAIALSAAAFVMPVPALASGLIGLGLGHAAFRQWFERRLGGYTGDCLGAIQQTSEVGFYLGLAAWL